MNRSRRLGWRLLLGFLVLLTVSGCGLLGANAPELGPAEVTAKFYRWCIGYPGNPTIDRAYRTSPHLAQSFIERVDAILASPERGGADPLLLAQDIPERFTVEEAQIEDGRATVVVNFFFSGNDTPSQREVELQLVDGAWLITGVGFVE